MIKTPQPRFRSFAIVVFFCAARHGSGANDATRLSSGRQNSAERKEIMHEREKENDIEREDALFKGMYELYVIKEILIRLSLIGSHPSSSFIFFGA